MVGADGSKFNKNQFMFTGGVGGGVKEGGGGEYLHND